MSELLTEEEAAAVLKVSKSWLRQRRYAGEGPPFLRLGGRLIRYTREAVLAWADDIDDSEQQISTHDEAGNG